MKKRMLWQSKFSEPSDIVPQTYLFPKKLLDRLSNGSDKILYRALSRLSELGLIEPTDNGPRLSHLMSEFAHLKDRDAGESILPALAKAIIELTDQALESKLPERMISLKHMNVIAQAAEKMKLQQTGVLYSNYKIMYGIWQTMRGPRGSSKRSSRSVSRSTDQIIPTWPQCQQPRNGPARPG